jgi:hypothetical protein
MAITTEELLSTLGIDGVDSIDKFKESFSKNFISKQVALDDDEIKSKHIGKFTGIISNSIKNEFGLEKKDIEGKKVEEIISMASALHKNKIAELEGQISKTKDEVVAEWQTKAEKYKKDATDFKTQAEQLQKAFEETRNGFESEKKGWHINQKYGDVYKEAISAFSEEVKTDNLKIEGFNSLIAKKYKFELDENNELSVFDAEGKRIQNPNKLGSFMSPKEVLLKEATENKMVKLNDGGGQRKPTAQTPQRQQSQAEGGKQLHPGLAMFNKRG